MVTVMEAIMWRIEITGERKEIRVSGKEGKKKKKKKRIGKIVWKLPFK